MTFFNKLVFISLLKFQIYEILAGMYSKGTCFFACIFSSAAFSEYMLYFIKLQLVGR